MAKPAIFLRFHMRDAYGNRMLDDFSAQLWYHIVDANCDPRDPYDPLCVPVDQVGGNEKVGRLATLNWFGFRKGCRNDGRIEQKLACIVVLVRFCIHIAILKFLEVCFQEVLKFEATWSQVFGGDEAIAGPPTNPPFEQCFAGSQHSKHTSEILRCHQFNQLN